MGKQGFYVLMSLVVISFLLVITGCIIIAPGHGVYSGVCLGKHKRTEHVSAPLASGATLVVKTHNGSITISGTEAQECTVTANISVRAATNKAARKLAEQVKVRLQPSGRSLAVKVDKPFLAPGHSVSIDFDIAVPTETALELSSHNGSVEIANIHDRVTVQTHNGSITAKAVTATMKATTHNGCIDVGYSETPSETCQVALTTHNGRILLTPPRNFSGSVDIETHNGKMHTELPLTVAGEIGKDRLRGTIGQGQGRLRLRTHNGSIRIKAKS